jgi:hypothetical protein
MSFGLFGVHDFDIKGSLFDGSTATASNALANKQYVLDAVAAGGGEWFASVLTQQDAPPSTPSTGDRYLVGASGSGAWSSLSNNIVEWNGSAWDSTSPDTGAPTAGAHVFIEGGSNNAGNTMIYRTTPSAGWVVAANATGALLKTNNLSDLDSASSARTNLGLGSLATQSSVDLGSDVSGTLPVASGGTGSSTAPMVGLITAADASAARTVIGAGTIATQDSDAVSITGGSITGITDIAVADGGTGASDAATARTNLGAQAQNALLDDIAGLTIADGTFLVGDANGDIVAESGATVRTSLGLGTAAVEDTGVAAGDIVKLDDALSTNEVLGRLSVPVMEFSSNANFNYLYAGATFSATGSYGNVAGTILSIDSSASSWKVSISSGFISNLAVGDTVGSSGYSFSYSAQSSSVENKGLDAGDLETIIGNASTASSSSSVSSSNRGVAAFDSAYFTASSGFISLDTGIAAGKVAEIVGALSAGDLVKAVSWTAVSSGQFISSNAIDPSADTVKTQTNVSSVQAGQVMNSSGYDFTVVSVSSDGAGTPTYTVTVSDPSNNLQYLYNSGSFSIGGGDGFISAGAFGNAANQSLATGVGSSAQGKMLKVSASASLAADSLLAINSSGEIIAGTAGNQGTVTSISLADDDGDTTTAVTTSGSIAVVGDGTILTTNVNGSNQLEIAVATASTTAEGVAKKASSSTVSGDNVFVGFDSSVSSGSFDQGLMPLINADGEITFSSGTGFYKNDGSTGSFVTPTGYDLDGPLVKSSTGLLNGTASLPSSISSLEGAYIYDLGSISSDVSLNLPTSITAAERGATVTFKVQGLASGYKIRINGGTVTGGGRMTIDGADYVDLDQARQSVTLHLSAAMISDSESSDALCWSIL